VRFGAGQSSQELADCIGFVVGVLDDLHGVSEPRRSWWADRKRGPDLIDEIGSRYGGVDRVETVRPGDVVLVETPAGHHALLAGEGVLLGVYFRSGLQGRVDLVGVGALIGIYRPRGLTP
jgi:cell wall-associated NlpC family hydrolase